MRLVASGWGLEAAAKAFDVVGIAVHAAHLDDVGRLPAVLDGGEEHGEGQR